MITFFTTTKPFKNTIAKQQENSLRSWRLLDPKVEIFAFNNDIPQSLIEELEIRQIPIDETKLPLVKSMFEYVMQEANNPIIVYLNADIIPPTLFYKQLTDIHNKLKENYLVAGQRINFDLNELVISDVNSVNKINEFAKQTGELNPPAGSDFFAVPKNFYKKGEIPHLTIGRIGWDLWMFYNALEVKKAYTIDMSETLYILHQNHPSNYNPIDYKEPDARRNLSFLPPDREFHYTLEVCQYNWKNGEIVEKEVQKQVHNRIPAQKIQEPKNIQQNKDFTNLKTKKIYPSTKVNRKPPQNIKSQDNFIFDNEYSKEIPSIKIVEFENVYIWDKIFFSLTNFKQDIADLYYIYGNLQAYQYKHHFTSSQKIKFLIKRILLSQTKKIKQGYWVEDNWSIVSYFHWITGVMVRILAVTQKDKNAIIILSQEAGKIPFIVESLSKLNIKVLFLDTKFTYKINTFNFIYSSASAGNYNEELINVVRDKITASFLIENTASKRRIYISRKKAEQRFVINEEEVEILLLKYNFECICWEDFTWEEQVKISMNTELLVSLHGSGLTNMIAMPSTSKVLELRKEDDSQNNAYFSLASALNINYYYQLCEVENKLRSTQEANFIVDINTLKENLEIMLNTK